MRWRGRMLRADRPRRIIGATTEASMRQSDLTRRRVILTASALAGTAALPKTALGTGEADLASAAELHANVRKWHAGLEPDKQKAASFAWNGAEWRGWNYFG